jgi:hypothetical protein
MIVLVSIHSINDEALTFDSRFIIIRLIGNNALGMKLLILLIFVYVFYFIVLNI